MKNKLSFAVLALSTAAPTYAQKLEHVLVTVPVHREETQSALPIEIMSETELQHKATATLGETLA